MKIRDRRKSGWFWLDNEVVDLIGAHLGPYSLIVYVALARITNNDTQASFPSFNTLARRIGLSRSTIIRAIQTLEKHSLILSQQRLTVSGDPDTNEYVLLDRSEWKIPNEVVSERHQVVSERHQVVSERHQVVSERHQVVSERHQVVSERHEGSVPQELGVVSEGHPINTKEEQDLLNQTNLLPLSYAKPSSVPPQWPQDGLFVKDFLDQELYLKQHYNEQILATLNDPRWWENVAESVHGLSTEFLNQEFAKMGAWITENSRRKPTAKGLRRFIRGWLERAYERQRKQVWLSDRPKQHITR